MVGGFEGGEAERFGDGTHDENVGDGVDVAELFAADEAGEDDVVGDAEVGGELNKFVALFSVAGEEEEKFVVDLDGAGGGTDEVGEAFLDGEAGNCRDDCVAFGLHVLEVVEGIFVVLVVFAVVGFEVEAVVDDVDFIW